MCECIYLQKTMNIQRINYAIFGDENDFPRWDWPTSREREREDDLLYLLFTDSITDEGHILSNNFRVAFRVTQSTSSTRVCFLIHRLLVENFSSSVSLKSSCSAPIPARSANPIFLPNPYDLHDLHDLQCCILPLMPTPTATPYWLSIQHDRPSTVSTCKEDHLNFSSEPLLAPWPLLGNTSSCFFLECCQKAPGSSGHVFTYNALLFATAFCPILSVTQINRHHPPKDEKNIKR